ncbi:hypothetical protein AB0L05_41800 [Nonomuraea pusilla]|uniref:hypothetical protein n=1 Tax=Nonomuraea pusilla TaxID=46177 RepID=UPI003333E0C4
MNEMAGHQSPSVEPVSPVRAAESLRVELERHGIVADVHDGYGLAVVSIWTGLTVWSDGLVFWWRTGNWDARRRRPVYAYHDVRDLERTARRVAFRFTQLRKEGPPSGLIGKHAS